jgi:hypothetical protein
LCIFSGALSLHVAAQSPAPTPDAEGALTPPVAVKQESSVAGNSNGAAAFERQLREQRSEIDELRALVTEQARLVKDLKERVERAEQLAATLRSAPAVVAEAGSTTGMTSRAALTPRADGEAQAGQLEERVARVETQAQKTSEAVARQLGSITFSGDVRLRYESIYGQQNALASGDPTGALGNPLTARQRLRLRARLAARGTIGKEFEWGLRFATSSFPDVISSNQTPTDFFSRKAFSLDNAYITWKPAALPGLQVQGGKFETPWTRTEMTWDNDITPEGLTESYTRAFKDSSVKNLTFTAWQLPLLERNAAFVVGADGKVDFSASRRAGRDLALYGAQLRARLEPSKQMALTLSAADLFFSGTQFITPAQVFGPNIQFPVNVTIPASGATPARTVTTQVSIPRELLVSGNANLGISTATTNAINRDGRLSSGYNLVDLIARLDLTRSKQWPAMFLFTYVRNTQARGVVTSSPGGADLILPNDEANGYWAEFQIGKTQQRGDMLFGYTFIRIEKDAVLTPFNFSDLSIPSDVRGHRLIAAYAADPRVVLSLTGIFSQRPNGLLGPFAATPPGSLNRALTRLQFDTIFRF